LGYENPPTPDLLTGRRGDIVDEGCLKSMNELEWRRKIGDAAGGLRVEELVMILHFGIS